MAVGRPVADFSTWALKSAILRLQLQEIDFYRRQFNVGRGGVSKFYFFDDRFDILSYIDCIKGSRLLPIPEGVELHIFRWDWYDFLYADEKGAKPEMQGFLPCCVTVTHVFCTILHYLGG